MEGARARLEEAGKQRRWASVFAGIQNFCVTVFEIT